MYLKVCISILINYLMDKYNYLKQYIDYTWHQQYSPEREVLHAQIMDDHFTGLKINDPNNPKIIFTGGCYGAGKGHTLRSMQSLGKIKLNEWVCLDPDRIRIKFPEYNDLLNDNPETVGYKTGKEAGYLVEMVEYYALTNGYNIIVDGSLKDHEWYIQHFNWIKINFHQYQTIIIFVFASWENIVTRNNKRCSETSRCVPRKSLFETSQQMEKSFQEYLKIIEKCYIVHNNGSGDSDDMQFLNDISQIDI